MAEKEQVKPLTAPSPANNDPSSLDEEVGVGSRSSQFLRRRRCALWCCGCCAFTVVVLGVVILILALTVFKIKDPVLTLNTVHVDGVNAGLGSLDNPLSVNLTLTADISIKNPNSVSFRYDNSTTEFYYEGRTVGVAYAPDGSVSAHRTARMNVTVDVLGDRVPGNVTTTFLSGADVNVTSYTDLNGRASVLGIYKRDVEVTMNCSMTLSLPASGSGGEDAIKNKVCQATVK